MLERHGFAAEVVLPDGGGDFESAVDVLRFTRGNLKGALHFGGVEQVAVELQDLESWAEGFAAAPMPADAKFGSYLCFDESATWRGLTVVKGL